MTKVSREWRPLVERLTAKGWTLDHGGDNHAYLSPPGSKQKYYFPRSSSDRRGHKNFIALLRREGHDI